MASKPKERVLKPGAKSGGDGTESKVTVKAAPSEIWMLEEAFPEIGYLLSPYTIVNAAEDDVLVVLDTNVLLLPYTVDKQDLPAIETVYQKLIGEGRLFVPARVVREFIKNRDSKLAEIAKGLRDKSSSVATGEVSIPPLLKGLAETAALTKAAEELQEARKNYQASIKTLVDLIHGWRGDDPVTTMYHKLLKDDVIVDLDEERTVMEKKWQERLKLKIPPGYKDASKPDSGIGDYAVWLSILKLGKDHSKNLVFVSGDGKSDWFVRADSKGVYPRPELIDEYRRASSGKRLHLSKLADVLSDMQAPNDVVQEVRAAETAANTAPQPYGASSANFQGTISITGQAKAVVGGEEKFDYSTNNGLILVGNADARFGLNFNKASDISIHLSRSAETPLVARAKNIGAEENVFFDDFDSSSRTYTIQLGELFLAQNQNGHILAGRVTHIADDTRGAPHDEVKFIYRIFSPGQRIVTP